MIAVLIVEGIVILAVLVDALETAFLVDALETAIEMALETP